MKIFPKVSQLVSAKSWEANMPWIVVGAVTALVGTWFLSTFIFRPTQATIEARNHPIRQYNTIGIRSPTHITPAYSVGHPSYSIYHPSYRVAEATGTPTYGQITHASTPTYGQGQVKKNRVY